MADKHRTPRRTETATGLDIEERAIDIAAKRRDRTRQKADPSAFSPKLARERTHVAAPTD